MGLNSMHSNGITHGNISPKYIGYDNTSQNFLLLDRFDREKSTTQLL